MRTDTKKLPGTFSRNKSVSERTNDVVWRITGFFIFSPSSFSNFMTKCRAG